MNERVKYWLELAEYDIETAKVMQKGKRYLYVGFMCHQTIEKSFKAVIVRTCGEDEMPPKIHDLSKLAVRADLFDTMTDEQKDFIETLNPMNIESRYPEHKKQIAEGLSQDFCGNMIKRTEELLCWIRQQL